MPELAVLNDNGWKITTCWDFEETENNLIIFDSDGEKKGWLQQRNVGKILPVEETQDNE
ncbi:MULTISPECIES: hypothetical protein [unclassified Haloferax]|uniref:Uncharacterized protein n=1 Tax=Haloferax sp. Atlit-48N TaxID=2077198 RepID=A0ACD5HXI7_9EURY|nr:MULTISPECIES: hypothetical protein [unclassified Haloferax]